MPISPSDRALGDLLVGRRVITLPQLDEAVDLAQTWNVRLGDALLSRNWIVPRTLLRNLCPEFRLAVCRSRQRAARPRTAGRGRDRHLCPPPDNALAAARRSHRHRHRRARTGNGAVRPPALGRRHRVRRGVQVRHRFRHAGRLRRRAVASMPCSSLPNSTRNSRPGKSFTTPQVMIGYLRAHRVFGRPRPGAGRNADRAQSGDQRVLSRQFRLQGQSWSRSAAAAPPSADHTIAIEARALREERTAGLHRSRSDVSRSRDAAARSRDALRELNYPLGKARHQDRARSRRSRAPSRWRVRSASKACSRSSSCRRRRRRPSRRPATSRCASRAANIW